MYQNYLNQIRQTADRIRSGEYQSGVSESEARGLLERPKKESKESAKDSEPTFEEMMVEVFTYLGDFEQSEEPMVQESPVYEERTSKSGQTRPKGREDWYQETGLTKDPAFMQEVERLQEKYPGLTKSELFRIIQGESGFNPRAKNKDSSAAGLFQFIPSTAAELGFTTEEIINMEPAEQVRVYDMYLDRWNYSGGNSLGIMQAAPAYANADPTDVIYKKGSKAWEQNPGWRPSDGGDITVESINAYYRGQS
jgi:hypothetical protein